MEIHRAAVEIHHAAVVEIIHRAAVEFFKALIKKNAPLMKHKAGQLEISRGPEEHFPDLCASLQKPQKPGGLLWAPPPPRRVGRRPAAAPLLVVVLLGRGVENARRRRHSGIRDSRVVCVRNPADCEVKSGALLRWHSPQALAMSHLRGFGFARDRNRNTVTTKNATPIAKPLQCGRP